MNRENNVIDAADRFKNRRQYEYDYEEAQNEADFYAQDPSFYPGFDEDRKPLSYAHEFCDGWILRIAALISIACLCYLILG